MNKWLLELKLPERLHGVIDENTFTELATTALQLEVTIETDAGQRLTATMPIDLRALFPEVQAD